MGALAALGALARLGLGRSWRDRGGAARALAAASGRSLVTLSLAASAAALLVTSARSLGGAFATPHADGAVAAALGLAALAVLVAFCAGFRAEHQDPGLPWLRTLPIPPLAVEAWLVLRRTSWRRALVLAAALAGQAAGLGVGVRGCAAVGLAGACVTPLLAALEARTMRRMPPSRIEDARLAMRLLGALASLVVVSLADPRPAGPVLSLAGRLSTWRGEHLWTWVYADGEAPGLWARALAFVFGCVALTTWFTVRAARDPHGYRTFEGSAHRAASALGGAPEGLGALARREFLRVRRDRKVLLRALAVPWVGALLWLALEPGGSTLSGAGVWRALAVATALGAFALYNAAVEAMDLEGSAGWLLWCLPVTVRAVLRAKATFWGTGAVALGALGLGAWALRSHPGTLRCLFAAWGTLVTVSVLSAGAVALSLDGARSEGPRVGVGRLGSGGFVLAVLLLALALDSGEPGTALRATALVALAVGGLWVRAEASLGEGGTGRPPATEPPMLALASLALLAAQHGARTLGGVGGTEPARGAAAAGFVAVLAGALGWLSRNLRGSRGVDRWGALHTIAAGALALGWVQVLHRGGFTLAWGGHTALHKAAELLVLGYLGCAMPWRGAEGVLGPRWAWALGWAVPVLLGGVRDVPATVVLAGCAAWAYRETRLGLAPVAVWGLAAAL